MEQWQREGFESFRAWRLAKEKARKAAKKLAAATPVATTANAAAASAAVVAAADEPMAQAIDEELHEDGWPVYNNPVVTAAVPMDAESIFQDGSSLPPPLSAQPQPMVCDELTARAESVLHAEATLAVLEPITQGHGMLASPAPRRELLQPLTSELTPGGENLVHRLEDTTPRGTHVASAEYKAAAATPEGEAAEERERRLATERQRLHRARETIGKSLEQQLEAERAALAKKAAQEEALEARRAAYAMKLARRAGNSISWEEMAPSSRAAASAFGFMRGMWDQRDSGISASLIQPLLREEWWWPWDELPRSLRLAAVNLGYDRMSWQTEEFEQCGQRFLDMEELMFEMENPGGAMWRDDVHGVQSDSELISPGLGRCLDGRVVTADSHRTMTYPLWYVERTGVRFKSFPE